jgi:ABC-type phosphate/phosphonate transport system substrate-binding protein
MMVRARMGLILPALATAVPLLTCPGPAAGDEPPGGPVRVGLVNSLFRDLPPPVANALMVPFGSLMKEATGMSGKMTVVGDAHDLGKGLYDGKLQLGVFHGYEFAWAKQKYPDLKPLCIAVNQSRHLYVHLIVRYDSDARDLADLRGKVLAVAHRSPEPVYLFLDRACAAAGTTAGRYFARVTKPAHVEAALDDVVRGKVQAAAVDSVALECYETIKPGCFTALRTVQRSEAFPAAVVAYREGAVDGATLARFRDGMANAHKNERSRELLTMWKLTGFETIPEDYEENLANILRAYPAPEDLGIRVQRVRRPPPFPVRPFLVGGMLPCVDVVRGPEEVRY